jgi:hypothetical protein
MLRSRCCALLGCLLVWGCVDNSLVEGEGAAGWTGSGGTPAADEVPCVVVDQFGYLPDGEKTAVIRDPEVGFDADESFSPGSTYALVDATTDTQVFTGEPTPWNAGAVDSTSGDRAWWFDFTSFTTPGRYYVLDVERDVRSHEFEIRDDVYREVLKQALRTFFYQRAGQDKREPYAEAGWVDGPSHVGPGQDHECRQYDRMDDAASARDVWGGWYDAGDYNKYTNWTASYVVALLRAHTESPTAWTDDVGIPESGNGTPDVLDEARWGLDHLARLQGADGSVLSIIGEATASPPSWATDPSRCGPPSTSATLSAAAAFATAALVLEEDAWRARAEDAWTWAEANPEVTFRNNSSSNGSEGVGAGQQEVGSSGRALKRIIAACNLFELTGDAAYRDVFDAGYADVEIMRSGWLSPWAQEIEDVLLRYTTLEGATPAVVTEILATFHGGFLGGDWMPAYRDANDPYRAHIQTYTWASNATKAMAGLLFRSIARYGIDATWDEDAGRAAEHYLHYLHGVNPFGIVYLSNMGAHGAERSVREFFHSWFRDGSPDWDRVGASSYGPAPGFLVGGPNASFAVDACCETDSCYGCDSVSLEPPLGQPPQKSFKEFNTSWPVNSWAVTENSNGYQVAYLRLLAQYVR